MTLPFGLRDVTRVVVYKRDEITTDRICCDVTVGEGTESRTFLFHEEMPVFETVMTELAELPGFIAGWRERVTLPPFDPCVTILFDASSAHAPLLEPPLFAA